MKRLLLVVALVLIMAAVAAPSALAKPVFYYQSTIGGIFSFPSKQECEQARAADPTADSAKCSNANTL